MSHSVFKEYPAATSFDIKSHATAGKHKSGAGDASPAAGAAAAALAPGSDNVVIVLNKDGSVSVDQHALHTFLREYSARVSDSD